MLEKEYKKRKYRKKSRSISLIIKIVVSSFSLLVLLIVAAIIYVWFMGQQKPKNTDESGNKTDSSNIIKHIKPSANQPEGVSIQSFTSKVLPGSNASITIRATHPYSKCSITVKYDKVYSKDSGLVTKTTDDFGMATWSWTVDSDAPIGKWPVTVTCVKNKKSGVVIGDLVITNKLEDN